MVFGWPLCLEIFNKQLLCTLTCLCSTTVRGADEGDEGAQTLSPYLPVSQLDIHFWAWSQTVGHIHPFLLQHRMPGEIRSSSAKTCRYISDEEGRTERDTQSCSLHTHTYIYTLDWQTLQTYIHTDRPTRCFPPVYMCQSASLPIDRGVLISGAGSSARRHGCCDRDHSDKSHHADYGGSRLYVI